MSKPKPTLEQLKVLLLSPVVKGGKLKPRPRKTAEMCWEIVSQIAEHYRDTRLLRGKPISPKAVEEEFRLLYEAASDLSSRLTILTPKAVGFLQRFAEEKGLIPPEPAPIVQPRTMAKPRLAKMRMTLSTEELQRVESAPAQPSKFDLVMRGFDVRTWFPIHGDEEDGIYPSFYGHNYKKNEVTMVGVIAKLLEEEVNKYKIQRIAKGVGGTFEEEDEVPDPEDLLLRWVLHEVLACNSSPDHARVIMMVIDCWARGMTDEDEWPNEESYGLKRLRNLMKAKGSHPTQPAK